MRKSGYTRDEGQIEEACDCYECRAFNKGSIRQFYLAGEMLVPILVSLHNVRFYQRLMADVRRAIGAGQFDEFRRTDPRCGLGPREEPVDEDVMREP